MSVTADVTYWLERTFYMSRATVIHLRTQDAVNIHTTLKVLSDEKEALEVSYFELKRRLAVAEAEASTLARITAKKKPEKKA